MTIRLSALARADLHAIALKVRSDQGKHVAARIIVAITAAVQRLDQFPQLGRPGRVSDTREMGIAGLPFFVVYRARNDVIEVLRVLHGAMLWPPAEP